MNTYQQTAALYQEVVVPSGNPCEEKCNIQFLGKIISGYALTECDLSKQEEPI